MIRVFELFEEMIDESKKNVNHLRQSFADYMIVLRSIVKLTGADPDEPIEYISDNSSPPDASNQLYSLEKLVREFDLSYSETVRSVEMLEKKKEEMYNEFMKTTSILGEESREAKQLQGLIIQAELIGVDLKEIELKALTLNELSNVLIRAGYENVPRPASLLDKLKQQKSYPTNLPYHR